MSDINVDHAAADAALADIVAYTHTYKVTSQDAVQTAQLCLQDSIACALMALNSTDCQRLLGPIVPHAQLKPGVRVLGTAYELEPVQAAFNIGALIRWLDYNDTWLAAEWGHPSDNFAGILACADYLARCTDHQTPTVGDVLHWAIKAYEIQGVLALENSFNRLGLDHVLLVRIASTAVLTAMLGGREDQIINALSNAWIDGGALRTYRHAPNTGTRKSWAAGDASRRAMQHALMAMQDEMGYATALTASNWGFYDVIMKQHPLVLKQPYQTYVMENVLFKVSYPAEFHAQTAVEAAVQLHPHIKDRMNEIVRIEIATQSAAMRIIDKVGPLHNPADRDHCLQYMVAVALLKGGLVADDYLDEAANLPLIDQLREKMIVHEDKQYSRDYLAADKRAIPNAVQVFFNDGSSSDRIEIYYPIGHKRRRRDALPLLAEKYQKSLTALPKQKQAEAGSLFDSPNIIDMPIDRFLSFFVSD